MRPIPRRSPSHTRLVANYYDKKTFLRAHRFHERARRASNAPGSGTRTVPPTGRSWQGPGCGAVVGSWAHPVPNVPGADRTSAAALGGVFGPAAGGLGPDDLMVVGQIGQSLDGRVATATGHSHYINGPGRARPSAPPARAGRRGGGRASAPRSPTIRSSRSGASAGPQPARVVIDPRGRLPARRRLLAADGVRRW